MIQETDSQNLLGQPLDRIDGRVKVIGRAPYAYEHNVPNGVAGRAGYQHYCEGTRSLNRYKRSRKSAWRATGADARKCAEETHAFAPTFRAAGWPYCASLSA
jgi:CO/xanthine dehydrogenase Mo-binding subunit